MLRKFGAGVSALLLIFICTLASAQEATRGGVDKRDPCPDATTQFDLNQCAAREHQKADAELNKVYQQLVKDSGVAERAKLRAAQLAWIKFRDTHCAYASAGNEGGSIYPMVFSFCLADVTSTRTKQLQEILRERAEH